MNTHIGKIGRLPRDTRHLLGQRIENGIPNKELVQWLNASPNVKDLLALRFGGRAITEQNLSEWKQTGHVEWLRREERRALALQWLEQRDEEAMDPEESAAEKAVSDRLGRELGLEMAGLALAMVEQAGSPEERWERLCKIYKEVSQLRRDDQRATQIRIQRERWEREQAKEEARAERAAAEASKREMLNLLQRPRRVATMAPLFGPGKMGATLAELAERIKAEEDLGKVNRWFEQAMEEGTFNIEHSTSKAEGRPKGRQNEPNPGKSDLIQTDILTMEGHGPTQMGKEEEQADGPSALLPGGAKEEAPNTNLQAPEKPQGSKPEVRAQKTEEIGMNPGKSNQEIQDEQ